MSRLKRKEELLTVQMLHLSFISSLYERCWSAPWNEDNQRLKVQDIKVPLKYRNHHFVLHQAELFPYGGRSDYGGREDMQNHGGCALQTYLCMG